jgi:hypothetical protein
MSTRKVCIEKLRQSVEHIDKAGETFVWMMDTYKNYPEHAKLAELCATLLVEIRSAAERLKDSV